MKVGRLIATNGALSRQGFTLAEVAISLGIAAVALGALIFGYVLSAQKAEWSAYSLAAQSLSMQRLEQARAAKYDPTGSPPVDQLVSANFPTRIDVLDIPRSGTNYVYATNYTTISTITTVPPLKLVKVDTVWKFMNRGLFTNTTTTYRTVD